MRRKRKGVNKTLRVLLLLVALLIGSNTPAFALIQNDVRGTNDASQVDKSNANDGFIIENAGPNVGFNGGLLFIDQNATAGDSSKYRSIINDNGDLMIRFDGNGDTARILTTKDGIGGGANSTNGVLTNATIQGTSMVPTGSTFVINGDLIIPDGASNGFVLTADKNGKVSWQPVDVNGTPMNGNELWTDNVGIFHPNDSQNVSIAVGGTNASADIFLQNTGAATFNTQQNAVDFVVRTSGDASKLFVQGTTDSVGIGTSSPSAELDVGGGSADFIDGTDDLLVADDAEIDGNLIVEGSSTFTGTVTAGTVNGTFVGDGSGLTGVLKSGEPLEDIELNGTTLVKNGATLKINGSLLMPDGAVNGYVLVTDGNGLASWQAVSQFVDNGTTVVNNNTFEFYQGDVFYNQTTLEYFNSTILIDNTTTLIDNGTYIYQQGDVFFNQTTLEYFNSTILIDNTTTLIDNGTYIYDQGDVFFNQTILEFNNGSYLQDAILNGRTLVDDDSVLVINGALQVLPGTAQDGYILVSDANGFVSWQPNTGNGGGNGSGLWYDNNGTVHLVDSANDSIVIGGTDLTSADITLGKNGDAVFNEQGLDSDFRIEGQTDPDLVFVQASTDSVGIGTNSPSALLDIGGGTADFITADDVLIGTDVEVDGVLYADNILIANGAAAGLVLTSDATGLASWQTIQQFIDNGTTIVNNNEFFVNNGVTIYENGDIVYNQTELFFNQTILNIDNGTTVIEQGDVLFNQTVLNVDNSTILIDNSTVLVDNGTYIFEQGDVIFEETILQIDNSTILIDNSTTLVDNATYIYDETIQQFTNQTVLQFLNGSYLQDAILNGTTLVENDSSLKINGELLFPGGGANNGWVLVTDTNGKATWMDPALAFNGDATVNASSLFAEVGDVYYPINDGGNRTLILGSSSEAAANIILDNGGGAVFNEQANANADFRVQTQGKQHALFVQAATDNVGISSPSPSATLDIGNGTLDFVDGVNDLLVGGDAEIDGKTITTQFQIPTGANAGFVLTSDAAGNASWQVSSGGCNALSVLTPRVLSPVNGATSVGQNSNIEITFNGLLLSGPGDIRINNVTDNTLVETIPADDSRVTIESNKVTINPNATLGYSDVHAIQIDNNAFQNAMGCNEFWPGYSTNGDYSFTVEAPPGLAVSGRSPGNNATGVSRTGNFAITFNVPVDVTAQAAGFAVYQSNGSLYQAFNTNVGSLSNGNRTVTFTNAGKMNYSEQYYILVDPNLFENQFTPGDFFGGYATNTAWRFTITAPASLDFQESIDLPANNSAQAASFDPLNIDGSSDTPVTEMTLQNSRVAGDSRSTITFDTSTGIPNGVTQLLGSTVSLSFPGDAAIPNSYANRYTLPNQEYAIYVDGGVLYFTNELGGTGTYTTRTITVDYQNY